MLLYALGGAWAFWLWKQDVVAYIEGRAHPKALPGACPASVPAMVFAAVGALVLLAVETSGEYALGISVAQDKIAAAFLLAMLAAAVIEEIVFRGFLVITHKGRAVLWSSVIVFSLIFALIHPYLWDFQMPEDSWMFWQGEWTWKFNTKGIFSTAIVLLNSLWFYAVRFLKNNPEGSLLPCFVAHGVSNLGVFLIKLAQGYVVF